MARRKLVRTAGDVRQHPRYSILEAAEYLHIPASTLKSWIRGQRYRDSRSGKMREFKPLIEAADPKNRLLSFYNLAEAHLLRSTTEREIPLKNVRKALDYVRGTIKSIHPLLTEEFSTYGKSVFVNQLGQTVNATHHGQVAMSEILEKYLERLEWDETGMPIQIFPIRTTHLAINPLLSSGKPVVKGTGVMVSILRDRRSTGESIPDIAQDYGIEPFEIEQAIQEFAAAQ